MILFLSVSPIKNSELMGRIIRGHHKYGGGGHEKMPLNALQHRLALACIVLHCPACTLHYRTSQASCLPFKHRNSNFFAINQLKMIRLQTLSERMSKNNLQASPEAEFMNV